MAQERDTTVTETVEEKTTTTEVEVTDEVAEGAVEGPATDEGGE
jgi:hypothetical protein